MRAVGDYVIVKQETSVSSGIMVKENNVGKVIDCQCDKSIVGKKYYLIQVIFMKSMMDLCLFTSKM